MEFVWDIQPDKMFEQLTVGYVKAIQDGLLEIAKKRAPEITVYMQLGHPWQNRTGMAESTLSTTVEQVETELVEILMQHGVQYGWYLEGINPATMMEMMNHGQWAILAPTADYWGPIILQDIQKILR